MQKYFYVYKTTNNINNKIYIGCHISESLDNEYMGSGKRIKAAIAKYGIGNFKKEIIEVFSTREEMYARERELVTEKFLERENVYNIRPGGKGGFTREQAMVGCLALEHKYGKDWRVQTGKKCAEMRKDLYENDEKWRENFLKKLRAGVQKSYQSRSGGFKGKRHSKETVGKMKLTHKTNGSHQGTKNSQYGTMWITDGTENTRIKKQEQIPTGWFKGRIMFSKNKIHKH